MTHVGLDRTVEQAAQARVGLVLIPFVLLLARWCAATHAALAARMPSNDTTP